MRKLDVREAFSVFYRRRRLALFILLATLAGTFVGSYLTYPTYESGVKILLERAPGFEIPFSREQIAFKKTEITQTQCELLQSYPVIEETVRQLGLDHRPLPARSLRDKVHALGRKVVGKYQQLKEGAKRYVVADLLGGTYTPPARPDPFRQAVEAVRKAIYVDPVPNTDIIGVTVRDYEPQMAAQIANALAQVYLRRDVEAQRSRARQVYDLIDTQVMALRPSYEAADQAVARFEQDHQARLVTEQIRAKVQEISALELTYSELVETQRSKILSLSMELARLLQVYDSNHPKVQVARSEMAEARSRLEVPATQAAGNSPDKEAYAGELRARIDGAKKDLAELSRLDGEYARLNRAKEQEEDLFFSLKRKREEAQIAEATRAAGTRIVESAVPAISPRYPRKTLNLVLALVGGLFLAGAFCGLLEFLDQSVRTPGDVVRATQSETVWSIPDWRSRRLWGGS